MASLPPAPETKPPAPRPSRRIGPAVGAVVLAAFVFAGGVAADRAGLIPWGPGAPNAAQGDLGLVEQAWNDLRQNYVDRSSVDWHKIAYGAIDGMTQAIGDVGHTSFLTPDELAAEQASLSGSYVGIGISLEMSNGQPVVVSVFAGGPAAKAGLRHGDVIVSVDGTDVQGMALSTISASIRGPSGTTVNLVVQPASGGAQQTVPIVRAQVDLPVVTWAMVPGRSVADISLLEFSTGATDALRKAIDAATGAGATGIVLDLRGNPGGYVGEAVGVASQFLASGVVYLSEDASGTQTPVPVKVGTDATSLPLVVLVDHGTASAAEIVAGALQDDGRAPVVGTTTFGTGTVLIQFDLRDGSALRIGTTKWLTPSGHQIWHNGITPTDVVALPTGAQPVQPDDLRAMTASGVAAMDDLQLAAALGLLAGG
jgi:carboxyl-terminal processing protease